MCSLSAYLNRIFIDCKSKPEIILRLLTLLIRNRLPYADQRLVDSQDIRWGRVCIQVEGEELEI